VAGHVFVSYAHSDIAYVRRLVNHLTERGVTVWFDEDIASGDRWNTVLRDRVRDCDALVLVMSPAAAASEWVRREVDLATESRRPVLPLLLAGGVILGLEETQYESVVDGRMPSPAFVDQLRSVQGGQTGRPVRARARHLVGVLPNQAQCFQERDLLAALSSGEPGHTQVLTGMGGVGKTQLAAAVARRLLDMSTLDTLVWVNAASQDSVVSAYARAGQAVCGADATDPVGAATLFLEWLATTTAAWLVVLDDLADPADLAGSPQRPGGWWPPGTRTGRVIVTTRRRDAATASHGRLNQIGTFSPAEAQAYLAEKFADAPQRLSGAERLAAELGLLPLMLSQAAAFIADQDLTCSSYVDRLVHAATLVDVIPEAGQEPDDYRTPAAAALLLSLAAADRLRPAGLARPVLDLLALLDPNGIPADLVATPAAIDFLTNRRSTSEVDPQQAQDALACLSRFNLVDLVPDGHGGRQVRIHALTQRAARDATAPYAASVIAAATALTQLWSDLDNDSVRGPGLRDNASALAAVSGELLWHPRMHALPFYVGRSLERSGLTGETIRYYERLAAKATAALGPDNPGTLAARDRLAGAYATAGRTGEAIELSESVLADRERVLGPQHLHTLTSRGNLAYAYQVAGRLGDAIPLLESTAAERERVSGPDHLDTLMARNTLAQAYQAAGRLDEAIAILEAVLADRVRVSGPEHPLTVSAVGNLGQALLAAGRYAEAIPLMESALADLARIRGPEHADTITQRNNLASGLIRSGEPERAIPLFQSTLDDAVRVLGPDHPITVTARLNLADAYGRAGDWDKGILAGWAALAECVRVFGPDHPTTLICRYNIGADHLFGGDPVAAVPLLEAALADCLRVLGPEHPVTRAARTNLEKARDGGE
jgi:tetratricopeptide (TPR) repeat protein